MTDKRRPIDLLVDVAGIVPIVVVSIVVDTIAFAKKK